MTSEILILTPSAVALAADSAITIGGRKTYNGANKLFMLSNNPPMGVMFYNNSYFFNIPLETLIKEFRKKIKKEHPQTVKEFQIKFKEYLEELIVSQKEELSFEKQIYNFIKILSDESQEKGESEFISNIKNKTENITYDDLGEHSNTIIKKLKNNESNLEKLIPKSIKENEKEGFLESLKKYFVRVAYLENLTGMVIVGFDEEKLFPSYVEFIITYLFDNNFLFNTVNEFELNMGQVHIKTLAQRDVINTFLMSIDEETEIEIIDYFDNIHKGYIKNIENAILCNTNFNEDEKSRILKEISKIQMTDNELTNSFRNVINQLKIKHSNQILTNIGQLPKDELSNLAESLINITSLKRKVQNVLETVGGPVDVAIITKGDGFIWTKRKHYFDAELNPQFFERD